MTDGEFFTFHEYMKREAEGLSPSAQDYLEMIFRLSKEHEFTRVNDLAAALNVQPPSVTRMIQKLADQHLLKYEKYGVIRLEPEGLLLGKNLLDRHNLIEEFLKLLCITEGLLESTEKMEHTINADILLGISKLLRFFKEYPNVMEKYKKYMSEKSE
ncbi:Fur family transcriptional regulator [Anaerocolumna cellulosilytica]|uniref:Manganese transport regulator n=1 Tax=Anaerocolumna cellulosilytica TaxID=433286 RepID=A0A6S6R4Z5_9FIRM|nr:iron dependent repressor, metal binding and dimerization domain protein [Anaerocolumna cellulosilytica]MBB5194265.1 Mn-dependent DtxR family transcriptional regulator [Anaerocolumna cellulosilytica]BCJ94522.1 Fur family transcriptional regulator [Anaerocolumna cellulosilytica]